ncbi:putative zinc transporter msc2 [Pseudocyphellaria aurata]|nr:putative zinc transporter msc2 [Pseudocyphellaria aurata]
MGGGGYNHEHVHGHHSHARTSTTQRLPLEPTSMNGGHQISGGHQETISLKPHTHSHSISPNVSESFPAISQERLDSIQSLPTPELSFTNVNGRPKGMERRRSSVGLPTHLRLGSNGYGFPPANTHKYVSTNDGITGKWITITEAISSMIVPLPYTLASLSCGAYKVHQIMQGSTTQQMGQSSTRTDPDPRPRFLSADRGLLYTSILTSATLLLVGLKGKMGGNSTKTLDRRKPSLGNRGRTASLPSQTTKARAQQITGRIFSVALPFYATFKLGGDRVALVMLIALTADIIRVEDEITELKTIKGWRRLLMHRRWTLASIFLQFLFDLAGSSNYSAAWDFCIGFLALTLSILFIPPPFPLHKSKTPSTSSSISTSAPSISRVLATQWDARTMARPVPELPSKTSPLVSTAQDVNLTLAAGAIVGTFSFILILSSSNRVDSLSLTELTFGFLSICATALTFLMIEPRSIRQNRGLGLLLGSSLSLVFMAILRGDPWTLIISQAIFIGTSFTATTLDTRLLSLTSARSEHLHQTRSLNPTHRGQASRFSELLIRSFQHWPLLHSILVEKDSRRIFYFMSLNFAFMLVQTFYGLATGSLGLLSDSVHMFFDCLALVVGLCASVMSKWPPSARFPYGYGKVDTLAGFANGIFLMLISIEIVYEAVERLAEGIELKRIGELLTVSSLGLAVNLVGMTAFGHAHHGHSHGSHDHSTHSHASHTGGDHSDHSHHPHTVHNHSSHSAHLHSSHAGESHAGHAHPPHVGRDPTAEDHFDHSDHFHQSHPLHDHHTRNNHHDHQHHDEHHSHSHLHDHLHSHATPSSISTTPSKPLPSHSHSHGHHHHHGNENMHGIYLHVLADTLGSVAVVISTLLIHYFGWSGFDPLASCLIAILIFASAIPLVVSSARTLLLTIPEDTEFDLRDALAGISGLRGVVGYAVPKFWLEEGDGRKVLGVIHVIAAKGADMDDVKARALALFRAKQMDVLVQVDRDGSDRCWCRGGIKSN